MPTSGDASASAPSPSKQPHRWGDWPIVRSLIKSRAVLDLGCGDGELTRSFDSVLVDLDSDLLRKAPRKSRVAGDIHNLPLRENSFSCLVLNHVLEHSPYPARVLAECQRIAKHNALVIINVPNKRSLVDIFLSRIGKKNALTAPDHYQHFSDASLFKLLAETGFKHIRFHESFLYITPKVGVNTKSPVLRGIGRNIVVTANVGKNGGC